MFLPDEDATVAAGKALGQCLRGGEVFFLQGNLGAGKTTFVRGVLQAFSHQEAVKSPTYTLVEPYELKDALGSRSLIGKQLCHFDLYRLGEPEELEFIGIRDYLNGSNICFIEWPEKGAGILPEPTAVISLSVTEENGVIGRELHLEPCAIQGQEIAAQYALQHTN